VWQRRNGPDEHWRERAAVLHELNLALVNVAHLRHARVARAVVLSLSWIPYCRSTKQVEKHEKQAFGAFGMTLDAATVVYMAVNFGAAIADNAYMGCYTLRGPEGFFEVSRTLTDTAGWGSDHLRMALVKPALGSLVISIAVFLGTLVSRKRLPVEIGLPVSALLSSVGPWLVFFWHRLVDPSEPWLPEFLGSDHWNFWG